MALEDDSRTTPGVDLGLRDALGCLKMKSHPLTLDNLAHH